MRIENFLVVALALAGCSSDWRAFGIDTDCREVIYFADEDGDGWGASTDEGTVSCTPPVEGAVRNNRDCDDTDPSVTGRVGSLCPTQLVAQDDPADFATVVAGGSEWVLMHAETELVWAAAAEQACGAFGWGGALATFTNQAQLLEVLGALGATSEVYAAWVGFHPTRHEFGRYDENGAWEPAESGPTVTPLCSCMAPESDDDNQPGCGDDYSADLRYLALVRDGRDNAGFSSADWCLGTPDEAIPTHPERVLSGDPPAYQMLAGHFICERPIPNPGDWALVVPPDDVE